MRACEETGATERKDLMNGAGCGGVTCAAAAQGTQATCVILVKIPGGELPRALGFGILDKNISMR